ncbi:MAG TPA: malonate decarboxylase subunit epsilon [Rhodopseudomonas sp.]|uniref:malonate decarboxylase subunit epsilon n=1 Tax=Rhodopseudomonas sp. TaxID=1078 RepID=UPI002ED7BAE8
MSVAFLFPGQGSQRAGMLHELPAHPSVASTIDEASQLLGRDVLELDEEKTLESTVSTQLAIYVAGVAMARALGAEAAFPSAVAGLSVGAYAAATTCGALAFPDGLRLVHLRASLMEQQFTTGYGLAAIVGLDEEQVTALVAQASTEAFPVYVGNLNAPRQIVVAGALPGVDRVVELAIATGCRKAERLAVRVPSHCPLLQGVADVLVEKLKTLKPGTVRARYISNRRARPTRALDLIREDVATNIAHPVRWHDSTEVLVELGTTLFVELNPGQVLSKLTTEAFPQVPSIATAAMPFNNAARQIRDAMETLD